ADPRERRRARHHLAAREDAARDAVAAALAHPSTPVRGPGGARRVGGLPPRRAALRHRADRRGGWRTLTGFRLVRRPRPRAATSSRPEPFAPTGCLGAHAPAGKQAAPPRIRAKAGAREPCARRCSWPRRLAARW